MEKDVKSFIDQNLLLFANNNSHCNICIVGKELHINKPWEIEDSRLVFDLTDKQAFESLNKIVIDPKFDAIIHTDNNTIEFIFSFLKPDDEILKDCINRSFNFLFQGTEYKCSFSEPSKELFNVARGFQRLPSDNSIITVPQLLAFKDFQRFDKLSEPNKKYFENRIPRCFYISLPDGYKKEDLVKIAKHLNFVMKYYDRKSPEIIIRLDAQQDKEERNLLRYFESKFPNSIALRPIDDVIIKLIEVARSASTRYSFLYYFQVFEYTAFYYLDDKIKKSLKKFLRNPAVINCYDDSIEEIIDIFSESTHTDEAKIRRVIEECCDPSVIWKEIENDKTFFSEKHCCDGDLTIQPLIGSDTTEQTWQSMWTPKLFDQLNRIRNCLVHAREKRESKGILPTKRNNQIIARYIPVISRMAEQIAIHI